MNERIKELAKQADGQFYEGFAGSTNFVKFAEDDLEKFAELVVRECARVGGDIVLNQNEDNDMGVFLGIKHHFGVEE